MQTCTKQRMLGETGRPIERVNRTIHTIQTDLQGRQLQR